MLVPATSKINHSEKIELTSCSISVRCDEPDSIITAARARCARACRMQTALLLIALVRCTEQKWTRLC